MPRTPRRPIPSAERVGWTLATVADLLESLLEAAGARRVVEIGSGASTLALVAWAERVGAQVVTIDPDPPAAVRRMAGRRDRLVLLETTGLEALTGLDAADAYLLDGDHNHYTVSAELRAVTGRAAGAGTRPLLVLGGTGWPWGRRDQYHRPEQLPPGAVAPYDWGGVVPSSPATVGGGWRGEGVFAVARREGGPANGVLTAAEDFVTAMPAWEHLSIASCSGVTVLQRRDATWAAAVRRLVGPFADHPLLAAIEAERVDLSLRLVEAIDAVEGDRRANADRVAGLGAALDAARAELALVAEVRREQVGG